MSYTNPTPYQVEKRLENIKERARLLHYCSCCDSYGLGQKMVSHIHKCDGSGLKNYWSKQKSELLRLVAFGLMTLEQVDEEMAIRKQMSLEAREAREMEQRLSLEELQKAIAAQNGLNAWERVTPPNPNLSL